MVEWTNQVEGWLIHEEQIKPDVWLFMCKRPEGFDWTSDINRYVYWAHVYVANKRLGDTDRSDYEHFTFREEAPLELYCVELEMRNKYRA